MGFNLLDLVRAPTKEVGFSPVYLAQQRDYNERYSIHEQHMKWWRWAAICSLAFAGAMGAGLVYDDSQSKYIPYVVERDHLGDEVAVGVADKAAPCDYRTIQAEINEWIYDVRHVSADGQEEHRDAWKAYNHTDKSGPAKAKLDEWFGANNPTQRSKTELVTTTTISTLPSPAGQSKYWEANWREDTRNRPGDLVGSQVKKTSLVTTCKHPTTDTQFKNNVSGVFVYDFDWKN